MNDSEALELYNKATGQDLDLKDLYRSQSLINCVGAIGAAGTMVQRMGGELRSRQAIAAIIACNPVTDQ